MTTKTLRILFLCLISTWAWAQKSLLDRPVTLKLSNVRLSEALAEMSRKADFSYSANASLFDSNRRVDLVVVNKAVRQVLDQLFKGTVRYKVRGNHLILLKGTPPTEDSPEPPKSLYLSGFVSNAETGEKISDASVFERNTLASALSDANGYYRLRLPSTTKALRLQISKQRYVSEVVSIKPNQEENLNVALRPQPVVEQLQPVEPKPLETVPPTTDVEVKAPNVTISKKRKFNQYTLLNWLLSAQQAIHLQNIKDTLRRPFQVSVLPFVGTNHILSGQVTNELSVNVIAGYSGGVDGIEVGGIANLVRGQMSGLQMAGISNFVGNGLGGLQFAGVSNHAFGRSSGLQLAGIANTLGGTAQVSQFAGVVNLSGSHLTGMQAAGVANFSFGTHQGMQLAGSFNFANTLHGTQISPFNVANKVERGLQLGIVNFADSSGSVPVGLFSFVRQNGYRRLELSANELLYVNATFKTGVRKFYNVFTAGFTPNDSLNNWLWSYGYGVGTALSLNRRQTAQLNLDFTLNALNVGRQRHFNQLNKLHLTYEQRLGRRFALAAGTTLNFFATRPERPEYRAVSQQTLGAVVMDQTYRNGWHIKGWLGYSAGFRWVI
jgi:hypothetical protein